MSKSYDEQSDREPRRMIYEIRRRVQAARNRYWTEGVDGSVSNETHRELAVAALQYHDVLHEFRGESIIDEGDFPDISPIEDRIGRKVNRPVQSPGLGRPTESQPVPAVTEIGVEQLVQITEDLDDLAKKLGFGAKADERTPHNEVDHDDLRALLGNRGQEEALEKLPGGEE